MKKLLNYLLKLINIITPKNKKKIIFASIPDYSDNAKAFYDFIKNKSNYEAIWIVNDLKMVELLREEGLTVYKNYSIKAILNLITSKYIVSTHNNFLSIKSYNQCYIALWHGMPLKTIYFLENDYDKNLKFIDYAIATSNLMKLAIATSFNIDVRRVLVAGQPRNDCLYNNINLKKIMNIDKNKYSKLIFYLPTYRSGAGRNEGLTNDQNIINIKEYNEEILNKYLHNNNYLLIVKLHPAEEAKFNNKEYSNIKVLNTETLINNKVNLNEVLNSIDLLITDYSSVYFDYLILNRPILFTNMDEKEYIQDRGFIFDNPDFWRPGPKVDNINNFISEIDMLINNCNYYEKEREIVNSLVNINRDNKSSMRIFDLIFKD